MSSSSPRTPFLDGILGFLSAFAVGLVLLIGYSILKDRMSPWPSVILLGLILAIWLLWSYRAKDAAEHRRWQELQEREEQQGRGRR